MDPQDDAQPFEAWVRRWWINDLALVDCECSPCSGTRQRRHLADTDGEFVVVLMTRAGRETVSQGDAETAMRPGDAVVWDSTKPARFSVWESLSKRSLVIPRAALDEVKGRAWTTTGVSLNGDSPATRLLSSYLDTRSASLPVVGSSAVAAARNATLELLMGALRADGEVPSTSRNFGASDGEPRQEIDPWAQVRDYRHAITYATTLPEVDGDRIGVWGSSYSGGHVLVVAAIDRRVKAVVAQVPLVSGHDNFRALVRADFIDGFRTLFDADRLARYEGKEPGMVPVVAKDPLAPSALPTPDSYTWFTDTHELRAPSWRNEVTLRSVELFTEYEPVAYMPYISPTPLLLMPAQNDVLTPTDLAIAAYEKAREPKKLQILPGGHFDAYVDGFDVSGPAARDWFLQHLGG